MTKMCLKLHSMIIFFLFTTSANSSNKKICDFISNEGKLRELGLYERFDTLHNPSHWLYARDDSSTEEVNTEFELKFGADWNFNVSVKGVDMYRALHKFSVYLGGTPYNCSVRRHVSPIIVSEINCNSYEF